MNFKVFFHSMIQHYERVIAVVVMMILVSAGGVLLTRVYSLKTNIQKGSEMPKGGDNAVKVKSEKLQEALAILEKNPAWSSSVHRIFVAPKMKEDPKTHFPFVWNLKDLPPIAGIPCDWLGQYGLPLSGPVAFADPDGDEFNNREEFFAGTNPIDPLIKPDFSSKLKVKAIEQKPFPFTFASVQGEDTNRKFGLQGSNHYFVKMGELIPDDFYPGFRVVDYKEKFKEVIDPSIIKDGKPYVSRVDDSELTVAKDGQPPIVLVKNKQRMSDEIFAKLFFIIENKDFSDVAKGTALQLKNVKYQVVSIKKMSGDKSEVIVQRLDSKQEFTLSAFKPEDEPRPVGHSSDKEDEENKKPAERK